MAPFNPMMDDEVKSGFWGPVTSRTDFCEENYAVTYYVAEFWNTVSNLAFIIFALIGLRYASLDKLEKRYYWSYYTMIFLGLGSLAFHGTLRVDMQLWDQIGMIWLGSIFIFTMFEIHNRGEMNVALGVVLALFTAVVTIGVGMPDRVPLLLHRLSFAFLSFMMIAKGLHLMTTVKKNKWLFTYAFGCYLVAFIIWNIDNQFCPQIREVRATSSGPVGTLTQLHAWWHVLTASAAHGQIAFSIYARNEVLKRPCTTTKVLGLLPFVRVFDVASKRP